MPPQLKIPTYGPDYMHIFFKIAAKLLKILMRINEKAYHNGPGQGIRSYKHWMNCLDMLITINTFLLELHEIRRRGDYAGNKKESTTKEDIESNLSLFPSKPDLRANADIESLSLKIAYLDCSPLFGRGRGFHYDDLELRRHGTISKMMQTLFIYS